MDEELDRFKRVDLCAYAVSRGYRLVRRETKCGGGTRGSTASSLLTRHPVTNDKLVVRLDRDGHWTYFSVRDDRDNGTIVDFVLRREPAVLPEFARSSAVGPARDQMTKTQTPLPPELRDGQYRGWDMEMMQWFPLALLEM